MDQLNLPVAHSDLPEGTERDVGEHSQECDAERPAPRNLAENQRGRSRDCTPSIANWSWTSHASRIQSAPFRGKFVTLSQVVGLWFGMDEHAEQFGIDLLETRLDSSHHFVDLRKLESVRHRAVQREVQLASDALELEVV